MWTAKWRAAAAMGKIPSAGKQKKKEIFLLLAGKAENGQFGGAHGKLITREES